MQIIALSAVCCAFGALALKGPAGFRGPAYVVTVVLALAAFLVASRGT